MTDCYSPIEERELAWLIEGWGQGVLSRGRAPGVRTIRVDADEYLFATRLYRTQDRRAEVVMAIEHSPGSVLLHHKGWYERGVFRLPTGGVGWRERVEDALRRELFEETGLMAREMHFLGALDCRLQYKSEELSSVSYVFHISRTEGTLRLPKLEDISQFKEISVDELHASAEALRRVPPPRTGWGRWRAVAHDVVHDALSANSAEQRSVAGPRTSDDGKIS